MANVQREEQIKILIIHNTAIKPKQYYSNIEAAKPCTTTTPVLPWSIKFKKRMKEKQRCSHFLTSSSLCFAGGWMDEVRALNLTWFRPMLSLVKLTNNTHCIIVCNTACMEKDSRIVSSAT